MLKTLLIVHQGILIVILILIWTWKPNCQIPEVSECSHGCYHHHHHHHVPKTTTNWANWWTSEQVSTCSVHRLLHVQQMQTRCFGSAPAVTTPQSTCSQLSLARGSIPLEDRNTKDVPWVSLESILMRKLTLEALLGGCYNHHLDEFPVFPSTCSGIGMC